MHTFHLLNIFFVLFHFTSVFGINNYFVIAKKVRFDIQKPENNQAKKDVKKSEAIDNLSDFFANKTQPQLYYYLVNLINSKDFYQSLKSIEYLRKIPLNFSRNKKTYLLKLSALNFNYQLFNLFLVDLILKENEMNDLLENVIFYNKCTNECEENAQFIIIKLLILKHEKYTKHWLNNRFNFVIKTFNYLLIEHLVNYSIVDINSMVYGTPNYTESSELYVGMEN